MERIASIEIHKDGQVFVTSGECPIHALTNGECVFRGDLCAFFDGVKADSDAIPSLECGHPSDDGCSDLEL